ncbi:SDR family oxidoreductase [Amnibacterium setariae]|uniref:SDR family oxidoreductase n=1 Tax=Amnibacterium setariae TaxID=2306585 RepID=A0A3A1U442_9MICO|nr:SDR family oxidoreductase [Amnibacterium setariae]RIX28617.1 SDR family oxidoreductase [Amnibacterium setariae]
MSVVLVTGAATGIGRLTAVALARAGHTVHASMRDPEGKNAARAEDLRSLARAADLDLHVLELDVLSQESADAAVAEVVRRSGRIDVVIQNAGHLLVGYTESFTAEDLAHLFDVNAIGAQRVNRAALPHLRAQRSGVLVYVGSTTTVSVPPFLGPYVASKFAFDALAQVTAYEVGRFGVETVVVMPGAFTTGTNHFPDAGRASDTARAAAYAELDPLVARNEEATASLFDPAVDADPQSVADEIVRVLALPVGGKPLRTVVDFTQSHVQDVLDVAERERVDFVTRLGFADLLSVER